MTKNIMQAQEKEIEIIVTYKCNWNCSYCCVDTHNQKDVTELELEEKINKISNNYNDYNVTLSGGEVGLLSKEKILLILDKLKHTKSVSLNTNGTFLKKYPELISRFDTILYHASPELDIDDEVLRIDSKNIEYLLIVTDQILHKLEPFLDKNDDIIFNVVGASNPPGINNPILSEKNKRYLMSKLFRKISKDSVKRLIIEKKFDEIIYL